MCGALVFVDVDALVQWLPIGLVWRRGDVNGPVVVGYESTLRAVHPTMQRRMMRRDTMDEMLGTSAPCERRAMFANVLCAVTGSARKESTRGRSREKSDLVHPSMQRCMRRDTMDDTVNEQYETSEERAWPWVLESSVLHAVPTSEM